MSVTGAHPINALVGEIRINNFEEAAKAAGTRGLYFLSDFQVRLVCSCQVREGKTQGLVPASPLQGRNGRAPMHFWN